METEAQFIGKKNFIDQLGRSYKSTVFANWIELELTSKIGGNNWT